MRVTFVGSREGNAFINELLAAVAHEVGLLGVEADVALDAFPADDRRAYVVIPHEYFATVPSERHPPASLRARTIGLCVEQPGTPWFELAAGHVGSLGAAVDISRSGARELRRRGVPVERVFVGYTAYWDRWRRNEDVERPVDVIHLGADTRRRRRALAGLASTLWPRRTRILLPPVAPKPGPRPDYLVGESKWTALSSSKVILNIHRDESTFFEWVRVIEAISNGAVVVSEHGVDTDPLIPGTTFVSGTAANLGLLADRLLEDEDRLRAMRLEAYDMVREERTMRALAETLATTAERLIRKPRRLQPLTTADATEALEAASRGQRAPDEQAAESKRRRLAAIDRARRNAAAACRNAGQDPATVDEVARTPAYRAARPRVSVLVPIFNHVDDVRRAIASVAASTLDSVEVVVLDDASTDDSLAVATRELAGRPWLSGIVFSHRVNHGPGPARNHLLERARGEYVFALDADNELYPTALERLVRALDENPDALFSYSTLEEHENGVPTGLRSYQSWDPERLRYGNYIDTMALLRRAGLVELGAYSDDLRLQGLEDYDLWCRLAEVGGHGVHVPEILGRYSRSAGSVSTIAGLDHTEALALIRDRYPSVMGDGSESGAR